MKSFLKDFPNNAIKKCNTIKFIKPATKCSKTKNVPKSILDLASDDIVLILKSSNQAVLLELTCPCEGNRENWHSQKLNKYTPLAKVIEENGWAVDLFAIEVGARGYSSKSFPICFKRVRFDNKTAQKATKSLSCISMKTSFYILPARTSSSWPSNTSLITIEDANLSVAGSKNINTSRDSQSSNKGFLCSQPTTHKI